MGKRIIKIITRFASMVALICCIVNKSEAQFSINFHIGHPPVWAPSQYANRVRYYYFPEYDIYYDAQRQGYYYQDENSWFFTTQLPFGYRESHLASTEKVAIDYFGEHPYNHFSNHRMTYVRRYHPHWSTYGWRRPPGYYHGNRPGRPVRPTIPGRPRPERPVVPARPQPERPRPGRPQSGRPTVPARSQLQRHPIPSRPQPGVPTIPGKGPSLKN